MVDDSAEWLKTLIEMAKNGEKLCRTKAETVKHLVDNAFSLRPY